MTWVNALALAGVAFVALPILIHLMGRAPARVRRFPSLRFLTATRLLPLKRTRIQDPWLLALRVLALILAAVALAGPLFVSDEAAKSQSLRAKVVVVDTGSAQARDSLSLPAVLSYADSAVRDADSWRIVRTSRPGGALRGAEAWLATQRGVREIVIISDFDDEAISAADLRAVNPGIVVALRPLLHERPTASLELRTAQGGASVAVRAERRGDSTRATWSPLEGRAPSSFEIITSARDAPDIALTRRAASAIGAAAPRGSLRPVALVYPNAPNHADLTRGSGDLAHRWQGEIVARLARDPLLEPFGGVASLTSATDRSGERLLLFLRADAGSETSAATQAALARAIGGPLDAAESNPRAMSVADVRAPDAGPAEPQGAEGDPTPSESGATRWLWLAALIMLLVEWRLRNAPHAAGPAPLASRPSSRPSQQ